MGWMHANGADGDDDSDDCSGDDSGEPGKPGGYGSDLVCDVCGNGPFATAAGLKTHKAKIHMKAPEAPETPAPRPPPRDPRSPGLRLLQSGERAPTARLRLWGQRRLVILRLDTSASPGTPLNGRRTIPVSTLGDL